MTETQITFKGINRAISQQIAPDGSCQEIINARFKDGSWRPIGAKQPYKSINLSSYEKLWLHDIENGINPGDPNWIGYKDGILSLINIETGAATQIKAINDDTLDVVFLKRTMIVTSSSGVLVFMFTNEKKYVETAKLPVPDVDLSRTGIKYITKPEDDSSGYHEPSAVLGDFFAQLNAESEDTGKMFGSIMYIVCYRLFDGSYILPSVPRYFEISQGGDIRQKNPGGGPQSDSKWWFRFNVYNLQATINNELYPASIESTKDLIDSVCVFATRCTMLHKIDETIVKDTFLLDKFGNGTASMTFQQLFSINDDFKKLAKSELWCKIHEFPFEDVVGKTGRQTKPVDMVGYYQDYATREALTTDQFTHHTLSAKSAMVYNDRLHLLNIKTTLGLPYVQWPDNTEGFAAVSSIPGTISVWVKTSIGNAVKKSTVNIPVYGAAEEHSANYLDGNQAQLFLDSLAGDPSYIPGSGYIATNTIDQVTSEQEYIVYYKTVGGSADQYYLLPEIVGYNDARAYKMQITVNGKLLFEESLTKNTLMNFAYWHSTLFSVDPANATSNYKPTQKLTSIVTFPATIPNAVELPYDTNRLQVSEIQNPLVFPAKNSYQIGTGDGITMASGSEPLSTGQFGQFPLQVFTTKGVWALEIGDVDILYQNVLPSSSEVIENRLNVISVGSGVVFSTQKGLFMLEGRKATKISEFIKGIPLSKISDLTEIKTLTGQNPLISGDKFTPGLSNALSSVDFLTYLQSSMIGFDYDNRELIVTNPGYNYSYLYCFDSLQWIKISHSYRKLINNYPKLLGITDNNVVSLSDESDNQQIEVMIISNAQSFEQPDVFKMIDRTILRANVHTGFGKYAGFYLFASNDLNTWQLITGSQRSGNLKDFTISRSHGSAKFFVFVVNGNISSTSEINMIDLSFESKWNSKLR